MANRRKPSDAFISVCLVLPARQGTWPLLWLLLQTPINRFHLSELDRSQLCMAVSSDYTCLQREKVATKNIKMWAEEATLTMQGCLDSSVWKEVTESSGGIDELTDVVGSWKSHCQDTFIPVNTFNIHPNDKPQVSRHFTALIRRNRLLNWEIVQSLCLINW